MVRWTLVITNSLGPVRLLCCIEILLYPCCGNSEIQRNFELWDQENYFVVSGFCYVSVLYNESPLYIDGDNGSLNFNFLFLLSMFIYVDVCCYAM